MHLHAKYIITLFPNRRHRGAPRKHLACIRQQRITKHDIVAPAGAAEGALLCLGRAAPAGIYPREMRVEMESERAGRKAVKAVAKEAINGRSGPALQQPRVQGQHVEQSYRIHTGASLFKSPDGIRVRSSSMGKSCSCGQVDFKLF